MKRLPSNNGTGRKGFTLVEIMIVVAIIGVLTAIAIPNYVGYIKATRYLEIKKNLQYLAEQQELYFLENDEYYPKRGRINIPSGVKKEIAPLGYTFLSGHAHRYRIRGVNNRKNRRYIIDVWLDYDFNGDGRKDRMQLQTWIRNGKIHRGFSKKIRHWR